MYYIRLSLSYYLLCSQSVRHLARYEELASVPTVAKTAIVQKEGGRMVTRKCLKFTNRMKFYIMLDRNGHQ